MAQITYGSITVSDLTDGKNANIWTTTVAPTTPNYTFNISNLTGSNDDPREGDIILYSVYRYTISSISATTVLAGNRQSLKGAAGTDGGKWYSGTGITGTSTTATIFNNSGVDNAVVGDMYLNTSTNNTYRCTVAGVSSIAKWVYVNNIKGSQGVSVTRTETEYYRKLAGGQAPQSSTAGSTTIPEYVDGCTYYTRTVTYLSVGDPVKGEWLEATTLTNQVKDAYDAWIAAGAVEQKAKSIVQDSSGVTVAAGINGADVTPGTTSTYGYNTIMAPTYLGLRYNAINLAKLSTTESTPELQFYFPSFSGSSNTPVQGDKGLTLGTSGMNFYHAGSNTADATLNSNGLTVSNGSIVLGTTSGTAAGNVTLSNKNFTRAINGTSHNDLRFAIGSKFGVASDGTLYSSGLDSVVSRVDIAETSLGDKVDTSTFNTLSQTVGGNSASITELSTITTNNGLTKTTNITNTVNTVSQTAAGNSSKISSLTTTLGTNADGTTKVGDIVHRTSAVEQDLSGFKTTVSKTYHKTSDFNTYKAANDTAVAAAKKAGDDAQADLDEYKGTVSETYATKSSLTQTAEGIRTNVSSTYETKTDASAKLTEAKGDATTKANKALTDAKADTTNKLKSYYTKTETDSAITQKAGEISLSVAQTEISKIEIGGRNLLTGTSESKELTTKANQNWFVPTIYKLSAYANTAIADTSNTQISISFDYSITGVDTAFNMTASLRTSTASGGTYGAGVKVAEIPVGDSSGHAVGTRNITSDMQNNAPGAGIMISGSGNANANAVVTISNVKLEFGNKATDWSPAPEDLEAYTDSQVSAAKAEIKVTTDGISTEVEKKTDKSTIISTIRQSAETVKIKASQVEINGTAIFNAIKSKTDAAYDAKGAASAAESNAKDYADGAVADKADKSNAVARTQRIYYRKTSSGAPSANKTWLATSGTGYGNWSLKVPQMTSGTTKYPYLYTAVQTQTVAQMAAGNACSCSAVLLDDTTTVIDGGTIITGDISAARMKVNSIAAINSLTTGKIDAARINVGQITVGSLSDGSSYSTTSQMSKAIGNAVSDIRIGGSNYIRNTGTFDGWTNCGSGTAGTFNGDGTYTFPSTSADGWTEIRPNNNVLYSYVKDCEVVLSAEVKGTNGQTISVMLDPYRSASATGDRTKYKNVYLTVDGGGVSVKTVTADGTWQKVYAIVTINDAFFSSGSGSGDYFGLRAARINTNHNSYSIRKIKLEKGNKATDWTPAPEDLEAEIDAKTASWVLKSGNASGASYSTILGYAAEGTQTTFTIDSSTPTTGIKAGDTVRLAYLANNMGTNGTIVYIVGTVKTTPTSATSITLIGHGLDTTVIDGGHILTGTIDANRIGANSITVNKLAIGDWTNLVTANELYPNSLPASSVSISNGYLVKTTATQQYILLTRTNPRTPNNFKKGDELYVEFYAKAASATTAVFSIFAYDSSNTYLDGNSALINGSTSTITFNIPTTETKFTGTITLTRPAWDTAAYYEIDLNNNASTKVQIYMRKVIVRKKSNGELIVDGSITADHLDANSIVIGKMEQDTKDQILNSNIHIGGTNLLGRTSNPVSYTIGSGNANATFGDIGGYNSPASEFSLESYDGASNALVITSTATGNRGVGWYTLPNTIKAGETYTFSCLVKTSVAATVHTHTAWRNGSAIGAYTGWTSAGSLALEANTWTDYSYTFTPSTSAQLNWEFMVLLCFTGQTTGVTCRIAHAKLETGNKATDWSPSPADVVNENLLSGSQKMSGWSTSSNASVSTSDEFGVVTLTGSTSNWKASVASVPTIRTSILDGTPLWLSFEYKASVSSNIFICLSATSNGAGGQASPRTKYTANLSHTHSAATTWQHSVVKMPTSLSALSNGSGDTNSLFVQFYNRTDNSTVQIRKVKLERGAYASEWTPSPEDFKAYITRIDDNGIRIHPASTENNSVVINASGMEVFQGGTTSEYSVAKYGDSARIGKESGSHLTLAPDSMSMSDGTKDVFNLLQKTMYIRWNRNYKGRQFANSTDRYVDSWETNTTISTWDSIAVNYKLNNTSRTKKITSISNGVLANDEIYVHFNYSGTIITLTYGRGSSAASSDIIKLESAVVYYVTDEQISQLHTGTYPNTTVSGALRIGNGTSDSNRRNLMLVDWSGTGKFKGDILAFCGADSSGGMSLTKAEENIDAFKYEDANGHVYIDAYRVGRIVSLLCSVSKTTSTAPGADLYRRDLTNAHLPKPLGTNTSGSGIYSDNVIIGNVYYNKTVTPNRYEFICRNGGSKAVQMGSTSGVGFTITYICQMDEVSGEIKYMDD